jgi:16S rRNA C967 or C1407 C5-methylase (RsmB/RsmF family)
MKSITDKFWSKRDKKYLNFVQHYKYHFQLVAYAMIEAIATKREFYLPTALVVVTKEDPPRKAILEGFEEDFMEVQHYLSYYTPHFMQVKTGEIDADACGECDYCLSTMGTIKQDYHYLTI